MTWQHLQQLRAAARSRIEERLAAGRPVGGRGASVQGNSITLYGGQGGAPPPEPDAWTLVINVTTEYEFNGSRSSSEGPNRGSYPWARAALVPNPQFVPLLHIYATEQTQFFYQNSEESDSWLERRVKVRFDTLVFPVRTTNPNYQPGRDSFEGGYYRMPVKIRVDHVTWEDQEMTIHDSKWLVLDRNGTDYEPRPSKNNIIFELRIGEVQLA